MNGRGFLPQESVSKNLRLRISQREYEDGDASDTLTLLGEVALEEGKIKLYPESGKTTQLKRFLASYRKFGVGPSQSDAEFLDHLPDRVGFYMGKVERL